MSDDDEGHEIEYDSSVVPRISEKMRELAAELNLQIILVHCVDSDRLGVSYPAMVPFLPRRGDVITLQDNVDYRVTRAFFSTSMVDGFPALTPNVFATGISAE